MRVEIRGLSEDGQSLSTFCTMSLSSRKIRFKFEIGKHEQPAEKGWLMEKDRGEPLKWTPLSIVF